MELRHNQAAERKGYMDAVSRSSRGFDDDDNDGEEFTRREASSSLKGWLSRLSVLCLHFIQVILIAWIELVANLKSFVED